MTRGAAQVDLATAQVHWKQTQACSGQRVDDRDRHVILRRVSEEADRYRARIRQNGRSRRICRVALIKLKEHVQRSGAIVVADRERFPIADTTQPSSGVGHLQRQGLRQVQGVATLEFESLYVAVRIANNEPIGGNIRCRISILDLVTSRSSQHIAIRVVQRHNVNGIRLPDA